MSLELSLPPLSRPEPVPFALGQSSHLSRLPSRLWGCALLKLSAPSVAGQMQGSPEGEIGARVARMLNLGNALAYGGEMGMPEWVMLDCGLLPSAFMGLCRRGGDLTPEQRNQLNERLMMAEGRLSPERRAAEARLGVPFGPIQNDEWVPVAEFCALPTLNPREVMGYSLFSLEPGLGVRAKALGLALHAELGATHQLGVAQYSNLAAVRSHLRFGPLTLVDPLTPLHTKAGETFIYRLEIPPYEALIDMASGARLRYSPHDDSPHSAHNLHTQEAEARHDQEELRWLSSDDLEAWAALRPSVLAGQHHAALIDARSVEGRVELCVKLSPLKLSPA